MGTCTSDKHRPFLQELKVNGTGHWVEIVNLVKSRTNAQAKRHNSTFFENTTNARQIDDMAKCVPPHRPTQNHPTGTALSYDQAHSQSNVANHPSQGVLGGHCSALPLIASALAAAGNNLSAVQPITDKEHHIGTLTNDDHHLFLQGLEVYGMGHWSEIATLVKSQTRV